MGEYALYQGSEVKIGTCESLYYLRWDQRMLVTAISGNINPLSEGAHDHCLWRFPWPWEDAERPGGFDSAWGRGLTVHGLMVPEGVEHGICQLTGRNGYLLNLPCPEQGERWEGGMGINVPLPATPTAKLVAGHTGLSGLDDELRSGIQVLAEPRILRVGLNGYGGAVRLVAQRWWKGRFVAVCECKGCGRLYRLPDESDAADLVTAIEAMAAREQHTAEHNSTPGNQAIADDYREVIRRLRAGYTPTKEAA